MRRIPGFRTGKPWKMVVASLAYLLMATWSLFAFGASIVGGVASVAAFAFITTIVTNFGGIRGYLPALKSSRFRYQALGFVAYPLAAFIVLVFAAPVSQSSKAPTPTATAGLTLPTVAGSTVTPTLSPTATPVIPTATTSPTATAAPPNLTATSIPAAAATPTVRVATATTTPKPAATATATTRPPATPTATAMPSTANCDPAYPDVCIEPPPPDLNCKDVPYKRFRVLPPDPHNFDADKDGIGCES